MFVTDAAALLFPGQGAQFPGMAQRHHDHSEEVRALFTAAEDISGLPLRKVCFDNSRVAQSRTDWTQPAVFVASMACWYSIRERIRLGEWPAPLACAGHSLGHFGALVAAGVLAMEEALRLVVTRGRLMHQAGRRSPGGMITIVGLTVAEAEQALAAVGEHTACIAAVNGPDQVVLAGEAKALETLAAAANWLGAERIVPLHIGIAAHTSLMAEANARFAEALSQVRLADPTMPVALNTTGRLATTAAEIRDDLLRHMVSPVLWWDGVLALAAAGVSRLIDVGPGRTLAKMVRRNAERGWSDYEMVAADRPGTFREATREAT
jgi:[acyl-carrier-protein] S-malonyltransferase